jgi:hypothetical protein
MLAGEPDESSGSKLVDTVYIFIDTDQSTDSGYFIEGIGSDFLVEIFGWNNEIYSSFIYSYSSESQDWNNWIPRGNIQAAVTGSELEMKVPYGALFLGKNDVVDVLFYTQGWDGFEDFSDTVICNEIGILEVVQQGTVTGVIRGEFNSLLKLDMTAQKTELEVTSIMFTRTGLGSDDDVRSIKLMQGEDIITSGILDNGICQLHTSLLLSDKETTTVYLEVDLDSNAASGNSLGFIISEPHDITTSCGTISLKRDKPSDGYYEVGYIHSTPNEIVIDGAFSDWEEKDIRDDNPNDVENKNLDIVEYSTFNTTETVSFYFKVDGEMVYGTAVPYCNTVNISSYEVISGSGGSDNIGPPHTNISQFQRTGEDIIFIYIDCDDVHTTGYYINGIGADHLIEIRGKYRKITSNKHLIFDGSYNLDWNWKEEDEVHVQTDSIRMEVQVPLVSIHLSNNSQVLFQITDWSNEMTDSSDESFTRVVRGDFPLDSQLFTVTNGSGTRGNIDVTSADYAPSSIGWGDETPTAMLRTRLNENSGPDDVVLEQITLTHLGTGESSDITVYIYEDVDEDGNFEPNEDDGSSLGSAIYSSSTATVDITDLTIAAGTDEFIWIVYVFECDFSDVGDTHGARIAQSSDLQVSLGDTVSGTFPQDSNNTEIISEFFNAIIPCIGTTANFIILKKLKRDLKQGNFRKIRIINKEVRIWLKRMKCKMV